MKIKLPFTEAWYKKQMMEWIEPINRGECVSITSLTKSSQFYRVNQFISHTALLKKFLHNYEKYSILSLDLENNMIEDQSDFEKWIKDSNLPNKNKKIIVVLGADLLVKERRNLISIFETYYHTNKTLFMFLFHHNIYSHEYVKLIGNASLFYQNVKVFPYLDRINAKYYISYLANKYNVTVLPELQESILDQCGGHMWFIKEALRQYLKKSKNIFDNDEMNLKKDLYYESLLKEEKECLLTLEAIDNKNPLLKTVSYFEQWGLIRKEDNAYKIVIPIIAHYIQKQKRLHYSIRLDENNHIIQNGVMIDRLFSKQGKNLLNYFLSNINQDLSRENCALNIWKEEADNKYSDWALDQIIKRLRRKLISIGLSSRIIQTKRNVGYYFNNI